MTRSTAARRLVLVAAGAAAAMLGAPLTPAVAETAAYRVVDLGTLPGETSSYATAVNSHGLVVGESGTRAVLWRQGRIAALDTPAGASSRAVDVNDRGEVIGDLTDTAGNRAVRWRAGRLTELAPLPGDHSSFATAINERGEVLGASSGAEYRAVLWRPDGTAVDLTARTGLRDLTDLDDRGRFVGAQVGPDGMNTFPVLWARGRTTVLSETSGTASAINDSGDVTGYYYVGVGASFTWSEGRLTEIPMLADLPPMSLMQAQAINGQGQVVGTAGPGGFSWDGRVVTPLPGLRGNSTAAADVNDRGVIAGWSATSPETFDPHAVLLLPRR